MTRIVLTDEQMRAIAGAHGAVELAAPTGEPLGTVKVLTPEERLATERYRREAGKLGPVVPSARVHAFLLKLHELADRGATLDDPTIKELLRKTQAGGTL